MSITLTIRSDERDGRKSRSFSAHVLALASWPSFWEGGAGDDPLRPVFLFVAASDAEARSVLENLRTARKATLHGGPFSGSTGLELPRSTGYRYELQRTAEGTLLTAYIPALFDFQPGLVDPERVRFIVLPAEEDVAALKLTASEESAALRHVEELDNVRDGDARLVRTAVLWASYLDERSELPIPPGADFRLQLHLAALRTGLASRSLPLRKSDAAGPYQHETLGYREYIAPGLALATGIVSSASHEDLRTLLATELHRYEEARAERARRVAVVSALPATRGTRKKTRAAREVPHVSA